MPKRGGGVQLDSPVFAPYDADGEDNELFFDCSDAAPKSSGHSQGYEEPELASHASLAWESDTSELKQPKPF